MIILKVTKNQGFTLSIEDTLLERTTVLGLEVGKTLEKFS